MPWTYHQITGEILHNGKHIGNGYSGAGKSRSTGRNNPQMQKERNKGPIPQGEWHIGNAFRHPRIGPIVMQLTPVGHNAFGRTDFLIHGNNKTNDASEGCIILPPSVRQQIADSADKDLHVEP